MGAKRLPPTPVESKSEQGLYDLARKQEERESQLYSMGLPLYTQLMARYQSIAANPFKQVAPALEEAARRTYGAEADIMRDLPRGGGQELALARGRLGLGQFAAGTTYAAREGAYGALAGLGSDLLGRSTQGAQVAAGAFQSLLPPKQGYQSGWGEAAGAAGQAGGMLLGRWLWPGRQ